MTAALLAALLAWPAAAETPVFYGTELEAPFLPVLPPAAAVEVPDDLRDAPAALPGTPAASAGWLTTASSLLLRAPAGPLVHELGVGRWKEDDGRLARELRGGASKDGRFAWHWQKVSYAGGARSTLVHLGSRGQILQRLDGADAPEGLDPAALSADGTVLLVALRRGGAWTVAALDYMGRERAAVTKAHRVAAMSLSEDGDRALVAWAGLDLPLMVSLFDLKTGERRDIPAELLPPGPWTLGEGWSLRAGSRAVTRLP